MTADTTESARDLPSADRAMPPLLLIAGPTATGKTDLAIRLGEALAGEGSHAEIISADSRQVFRGLDLGTAKPSVADRARIPHHGLDLVEPDEPFTVADFVAHARGELARMGADPTLERPVAILAGGTGLYLRAIARGLDVDALPADPVIRARIEAEITAGGVGPAAERLKSLAPVLAAGVDWKNPRRVARALEIAEIRGDAPLPPPRGYPAPVAWVGLDLDAAHHDVWIANRARDQFAAGLIGEAAALRERFDPALPAFSAIGYREAWSVLDGESTLEAAIELDAQRNRAFARRQRTWFRSETDIDWLDPIKRDPLVATLAITRRLLAPRAPVPQAPEAHPATPEPIAGGA